MASTSTSPTYILNDGQTIPAIGFGTYPMNNAEAETGVRSAIDLGYRLIDRAKNYGNEEGVGQVIAGSDVPREELFITTKLSGRDHGYESTIASFQGSLERLRLDYVDLYLIHWPNPQINRYVESWTAMIELRDRGLIRSSGVSNFTAQHIKRLKDETGVVPAVNQIELHPHFPRDDMRAASSVVSRCSTRVCILCQTPPKVRSISRCTSRN